MPYGYFDNTWAFVKDSGYFRQPSFFCFEVTLLTFFLPSLFFQLILAPT